MKCSQTLREEGKPYPRTCAIHGLHCPPIVCKYCGWFDGAGVAHDCRQELQHKILKLCKQRAELLAACKEVLASGFSHKARSYVELQVSAVFLAELQQLVAKAEVSDE